MNKVYGKVRWFDEISGVGQIRLEDSSSHFFYACNVVGADSHYEFLVKNVKLKQGDLVCGELDSELGVVSIMGYEEIELLICPYCGDEKSDSDMMCCGESKTHFEIIKEINEYKLTK